jgi:hypothetical protein
MKEEKEDHSLVDIIFGYTSLKKDSILMENYDFIQYKLNDVFDSWNSLDKNVHFVYKGVKFDMSEDRYGLETIQKDKYILKEPFHNKLISDFMKSSSIKYDMLVLGECPSLIDVFISSNTMRSLFDEDIKNLYAKIKEFYDGFKPNGILIHLYHNQIDDTVSFSNLEHLYNYASIWSLDVHLFLIKMMSKMFKKIEPGIYQKEEIKNIDDIIDETYQNVVKELFHIGVDKLEKKEELIKVIDDQYFGGDLLKKKLFSVEKPIVFNISNLVEESLKTIE